MSLINQMLRDLEHQRRAAGRRGRRFGGWLVGGLVLQGLCFGGGYYVGRSVWAPGASGELSVGAPSASLYQALPLEPRPSPQVVEKESVAAVSVQQETVPLTGQKAPSADVAPGSANVDSDTIIAEPEELGRGGFRQETLLKLGVLEAVASTRVMLEFERLPEYRWHYLDDTKSQIQIRLTKTDARPALEVTRVQGPLLAALQLRQSGSDLLLQVTSAQPLTLNVVPLPGDSRYGDRLLLEISRQPSGAPVVRTQEVADLKQGEALAPKTSGLDAPERASQAYREGLKQLQQGDDSMAKTFFEQALDLQPTLVAARLQLVPLLQKAERGEEAELLLIQGLELHPENAELRKGYARRLLTAGQLGSAIGVLLSKPRPEVEDDLEYYALLGALQQESGEHRAAVVTYDQLLSQRPRQALWWLGLAISAEQIGEQDRALEAYRQAGTLPGLAADLQEFVEHRLQKLSSVE